MLLWRLGQTPMSTDIYHVNVRFILLPSSYSFNTLIAERDDKFLKMGWGVRHEQRCVFIIFSVNNRKGEKQLRAWIWMWKIARVHFSFLLFPCEKLWLCEIWGGGDFENLCLDSGHTFSVKFIHTCDGSKSCYIYIWVFLIVRLIHCIASLNYVCLGLRVLNLRIQKYLFTCVREILLQESREIQNWHLDKYWRTRLDVIGVQYNEELSDDSAVGGERAWQPHPLLPLQHQGDQHHRHLRECWLCGAQHQVIVGMVV